MPVPKPNEGESKNEFISRCITKLKSEDPNLGSAEVAGICFTAWDEDQ